MSEVCCGEDIEEMKPSVRINIDAQAAKGVLDLDLGADVTVTVKGKLVSSEMRKGEKKWQNGGHIEVELGSVKVDGVGEFDDMVEED